MELSCGLPPGPDLPELAVLAEELGYARLWVFDSAPLWEDTFIHLALAAQLTTRIGLATAVCTPGQRSPLTTASAIATVARLAPGRLRCGFGTGFTARISAGDSPLPFAALRTFVGQVAALLRGETVDVEGKLQKMLHHPDLAATRPLDVPLWVSVFGPIGRASAPTFADGAIVLGAPLQGLPCAEMVSGTVLDEDEDPGCDRVQQAIGPWRVAPWHMAYGSAGEAVDALPGGAAWRESLEALAAPDRRHFLTFEGHVTHLAARDRALLSHADFTTMVGSAEVLKRAVAAKEASGMAELIYTPTGPDIERELRSFRSVVG